MYGPFQKDTYKVSVCPSQMYFASQEGHVKQPDRNLYFEWTFFDLILHFDSPMKMVPGVHCSIAPPLLRRAGEFSEDSAVSVFLPRHCFSFPSPDVALGRSVGRGRLDLKGKERRGGHQQCGPLHLHLYDAVLLLEIQ